MKNIVENPPSFLDWNGRKDLMGGEGSREMDRGG